MEESFLQEDTLHSGLEVEGSVRASMQPVAQWSQINAVVGFVSLALSLLNSIITFARTSSYNQSAGLALLITGLITAGVSLAINVSLYKFSKELKTAISDDDQDALDKAAVHIKTYFMVFMIMIIIVVILGLLSSAMQHSGTF